jgi:hypothetical protein
MVLAANEALEPGSCRHVRIVVSVDAIFPVFVVEAQSGTFARPQGQTPARPSAAGGSGPEPGGIARVDAVARLRITFRGGTPVRDDTVGGSAPTKSRVGWFDRSTSRR